MIHLLSACLVLAGFHGVLALETPWKRSASWCLLQAGLLALAWGAGSSGDHPLAKVLGTAILASGFVTACALFSLARLQPETPSSEKRKGKAR